MACRARTWVADGNQAMLNALQLKFSASRRQRCIKHKMDNVLGYVPTAQQETVKPKLKAIFHHDSRKKADQEVAAFIKKYGASYPTAVECLKRDLGALDLLRFPASALESDSHD
ncbi:MAG: transposase [Anaerolineae bacterium]